MGSGDSIRASGRGAIPGGVFLAAALGLVLLAPLAASARGPIYSFVDERGVTHFTNVPQADTRFRPVAPAATSVPRRLYRAPRHHGYDRLIHRTAVVQGVSPALVKAVIAAESAFDYRAVSHKGAQGLMQLMPATAASLGVHDAFEPAQNVRGGTAYLRAMIRRYGDLARALAAYNAGPRAVDRHGGIPPYPETQAYVERVMTYYRRYHGDFGR